MQKNLEKRADVTGPAGLWGLFNTAESFTASKDGYLLTMAPAGIQTLDDFTAEQEQQFWDFTFDSAAAGLKDPAARGHTEGTATSEAGTEYVTMCAINDGVAAWQAVGSVHGHIVWSQKENDPGNVEERLAADRTRIVGGDVNNIYRPLGRAEVPLNQPEYGTAIRAARSSLREEFGAAAKGEEVSFSLYTKNASASDPRRDGVMVVEMWSPSHHALASLSGFIRSWNNPDYAQSNPVSPHKMGYQYAAFVPVQKQVVR
jgi:hypothetical protein